MPALRAAGSPPLACRTTVPRAAGTSRSATSPVASFEPSSTTITSWSVNVWAAMEASVAGSVAAAL